MLENIQRSISSKICFFFDQHTTARNSFGSQSFKPFDHSFFGLIIGINFHPFHGSTPLRISLKDVIFIIFPCGKCICWNTKYATSFLALPLSSSNKDYLSSRTFFISKIKPFKNINQNSKDRSMVIMVSLLVRNVEKFELQRKSSQRNLKIRSNYRNSRITEIRSVERKLLEFLKEISR